MGKPNVDRGSNYSRLLAVPCERETESEEHEAVNWSENKERGWRRYYCAIVVVLLMNILTSFVTHILSKHDSCPAVTTIGSIVPDSMYPRNPYIKRRV